MTLRVWSETLPYPALCSPATLGLLRHHGLMVRVAVRPWDLSTLPGVVATMAEQGIALGLWPMLSDHDGRWAGATNLPRFRDFTLAMLDALPPELHGAVSEVTIDLEPPFGLVARIGSSLSRAQRHGRSLPWTLHWARTVASLSSLVDELHARGHEVAAAVVPMVLLDPRGGGAWQRGMGTPVDGIAWDRVSAMLYTSIFEGWSRGFVRRGDAEVLLREGCAMALARWGSRAEVSLGAVGTGALGDEPTYRDHGELERDVQVLADTAIAQRALFDLGGTLARGDAERWLGAFCAASERPREPPAERVSRSLRAEVLLGLGRVAGGAWEAVMGRRQQSSRDR